MSGESADRTPVPDGGDDPLGAPIDFDRLDRIRERLAGDDRFEQIDWRPTYAPDRVVCTYDDRFYPTTVPTATLELVWFENGDFTIHYHESHADGAFDHRWDRHPSEHNTRDHVHPGPDAPTPGQDASHPADWRDVLAGVLREVETRQRAFWTD
jgi:hypothetical protein